MLAAAAGGAIAKRWVSVRTDQFIADAARKYDVAPASLDRRRYLDTLG